MTNPATPTPTDLPEALRLAIGDLRHLFVNLKHGVAGKYQQEQIADNLLGPAIRKLERLDSSLNAAAPIGARHAEVAMIDAAMVEMQNIHPPLKRSECQRLIRAALAAPTTEQFSEVAQASPLHVDRATVIEWLDANDIEVTDRQLSDLFPSAVQPQAGAESYPPRSWQEAMGMLKDWMVGQSGPLVGMAFSSTEAKAMTDAAYVVSLMQDRPSHIAVTMWDDATAALRAREAVPSDDELTAVIRGMPGLHPWGIGTTVKDALRVGRAVLARWGAAPGSGVEQDAAQYRLLQADIDSIEATDEFLSDDTLTWAPDPNGIFVGMPYAPRVLRPARRLVAEASNGLPALTLAASKGQEGGA